MPTPPSRWFLLLLAAACAAPEAPPRSAAPRQPPVAPGFHLAADGPAVLGETITLTASLPVPPAPADGVEVYFIQGVGGLGAGPCPPVLLGDCMDVLGPITVLGVDLTAGGQASLAVPVPPGLTSSSLGFQALVRTPRRAYLSEPVEVPVRAPLGPLPLPVGVDLFEATGALDLDLPAGALGPGSPPVVARAPLVGTRPEIAGPFEIGTTDAVVRRYSSGLVPSTGVAPVVVELAHLELVSPTPLLLDAGAGPVPWTLRVVGREAGPSMAQGVLELTRARDAGGPADGVIPGGFEAELVGPGGVTLAVPLGDLALTVTRGAWTTLDGCDLDALKVPRLPVGVCLDLSLTGGPLSVELRPPSRTAILPAPTIRPTAAVSPDVARVGRGATIAADAEVGAAAVIGPYAYVGPEVRIGAGAQVGGGAALARQARLDEDAILGDGAQVAEGAVVEAGAIVQAEAQVGVVSRIGAAAIVGPGALVLDFCVVGEGAELGRDVILPLENLVLPGVRVAAGYVAVPGEILSEDILTGVLPSGVSVLGPVGELQLQGAAILAHVPAVDLPAVAPAPPARSVTPLDPSNLPPGLGDLVRDVDAAGVAPRSNGGTGAEYVDDTNDCDDFADRLERALQAAGYDATFTITYDVDKTKAWWMFWRPTLVNGHCLTDVHDGDRTIWIEAQFPGAAGVGVDLDANGDGQVTYATDEGSEGTDGNKRIEVYPDRAAAERARGDLD